MNFLRKHWPLPVLLALYWALLGVAVLSAVRAAQGHLVYPLDDAYIHMAIAKHFVQNGVWGLTPYAVGSSTSSPGWTLLLAIGFKIFGLRESLPLVLATGFGTLLLLAGYAWLHPYVRSRLLVFGCLAAALLAAPLPTLTFTGMEHVLHALLTLGMIFFASQILADPAVPSRRAEIGLLLLAPGLVLTRYESLFLFLILILLFLVHKKYWLAFWLGLLGLLPMAVYGLWSMSRGWYFLPNSVLLKGSFPGPTGLEYGKALLGFNAFKNLWASPCLGLLWVGVLAGLLLDRFARRRWTEKHWFNLILVCLLWLHAQFAGIGWFYRYEAYLIFIGILGLGSLAAERLETAWLQNRPACKRPAGVLAFLLVAALLFPYASRSYHAYRDIPHASRNIFQQQVQMGLFLRDYYPACPVVVNDCGAVGFLSRARVIDIGGIGSREAAALKLERRYSSRALEAWARLEQAQIAMVYEPWLLAKGGVPESWRKIETWKISDNAVCGNDTVSIYALNPAARESLARRLRAFSARLPVDVVQTGAVNFEKAKGVTQ